MTNQLYDVWNKLGSDVLNITLVPYGNAKACSMHLMKNFSDYFPFIHCIEAQKWTVPADAAKHCAKTLKIDMSHINDCVNGDLGNGLLHQMALKTAALSPPHTYVPWITFNGQHDKTIEGKAINNLLQVVCRMYQGPKPSACTELERSADRCYKNF